MNIRMFFFLRKSKRGPLTLREALLVLLLVLFSLAVFMVAVWSFRKTEDVKRKMQENPPTASPIE